MRRTLLLLVALVLAGCSRGPLVEDAPAGGPVAGFPNHTAGQIYDLVAASLRPIEAYRSEARFEATGPGRDLSASAGLRARLSDTLLAVVRGPLGIEGGRALLTRDSLFAIDRLNGRLYVGGVRAAERYVPVDGLSGRLARILLSLEPPPVDRDWRLRAQAGRYVLATPDGAEQWTVDPRIWRVTEVVERAADGRRLVRTYDAFDQVDGVVVPRRVVLASPDDGAQVTIEHREVTINPPGLDFPFRPSGDAEVVRIE